MLAELPQSSLTQEIPRLTATESSEELLKYAPGRAPLLALMMQSVWEGAQVLYYFKVSQRTMKKSHIRDHWYNWSQNLNLSPFA